MKTNSAKYKILVVDDEEKIISSEHSILSNQLEIVGCKSAADALLLLYEKRIMRNKFPYHYNIL